MKLLPALAALAFAASACTGAEAPPEPGAAVPGGWRTVATEPDRKRVRDWRKAWVQALAKANVANAGEVKVWGPLLDPDAALNPVLPPVGDYQCRTIKLGAKSEGLLDYVAYQPFTCRIAAAATGGVLSFTKLNGSQRPVGLLYPENDKRMIFLGTLELSDEARPLAYGHDAERDMAGLLERVGDGRWRIAFPYPQFESTLDVIELIPKR